LVSFTNDKLNLFSSIRPSKCPHKFPHQLKKFFLLKSVLHFLQILFHTTCESPPFYPLPFTLSTTFLIFFSVPRFKLQNSFPTHRIYNIDTQPRTSSTFRCHQLVINVTKVRHYIQLSTTVNLFFKKLLNCPDSSYMQSNTRFCIYFLIKNKRLIKLKKRTSSI